MRRTAAAGLIAVVAASLALGAFAARRAAESAGAAAPAVSGMELLRAFRCHRAERKLVIVRGVEDDFSPQGTESVALHPRSDTPRLRSLLKGGSYDQSQPDRTLVDWFAVPSRISRGLFVIGLRPVAENANDVLLIGEPGTTGIIRMEANIFQRLIPELADHPGWRRAGAIHHAEFADIRFQFHHRRLDGTRTVMPRQSPHATLLDYVRGGDEQQPVEVRVSDDTSVDFVGAAVCEEPPPGTGLSLSLSPDRSRGIVVLSCTGGGDDEPVCDPYVGDAPCGTPLPLACFRGEDVPVPASARARRLGLSWSGGRIAATEPVRGDAFATIDQTDAHCAARFGRGWRTLTYHDGGRSSAVAGYGRMPAAARRLWIDIRGQPYATCWSHGARR